QDTLSYTELKADADGVITALNAEVGHVAQAAQVVFTLAHDGDRDAVFEVVESSFLRPIVGEISRTFAAIFCVGFDRRVTVPSPSI
ncbi:hypothetical protein AB9E13_34315, partial [Rhizobium leguminosarum]